MVQGHHVFQITITDMIEKLSGFRRASTDSMVERLRKQASSRAETLSEDTSSWYPAAGEIIPLAAIAGGENNRSPLGHPGAGASWRRLASGGRTVHGRGSHLRTCDGPFYRNREVVVVGGGKHGHPEALS